MDRNQKITLGVLALIVVLGGGVLTLSRRNKAVIKTNPVVTDTNSGAIKKTDAPKGQIITGFPKELILDPQASASESYTIDYSKQNQYTVTLNSTMLPKDLFDTYKKYLVKNGYSIKNENNRSASLISIYATSASADVNVVATRDAGAVTTKLILTYLKH